MKSGYIVFTLECVKIRTGMSSIAFSTIAENFAIATNGIENREIKKRDTGIYRNVLNSHICSNKKLQKKCIYFKKKGKKVREKKSRTL